MRLHFLIVILLLFWFFSITSVTADVTVTSSLKEIPLFSKNNSPIAFFYPIKLLKNGYLSNAPSSIEEGIWIIVKLPEIAYPGTSSESAQTSGDAVKKLENKLLERIAEYYYTEKDSFQVLCYIYNGTNYTLTELQKGTEYRITGIKVGEDNKIISPTLWIRFDNPRILKHFLNNYTLKCIIKYTNVYAKVENEQITNYTETQTVKLELSFTETSSDFGIDHLGKEYCSILLNVIYNYEEYVNYLGTYCFASLPLFTLKIINNADEFDTVILAYRVFNLSSNTTKLVKLIPALDAYVIKVGNKIIILDYETTNNSNIYLGTLLITKCKNGKTRMSLLPPILEKEKDITKYTCLYGEGVDGKLHEILSNYKLWIENDVRQTFFSSYPLDVIYYSSILPVSSDGKIKMLITAVTNNLPNKMFLTPAVQIVYYTNTGPVNTTVILTGDLDTIANIIPDAVEVINAYKSSNSELKDVVVNISETNETIHADFSFRFPTYKINIDPWIEISVGNYKFILQVIGYSFSYGTTPYEVSVLAYTDLSNSNKIDEGYFVTFKAPVPRVSVPTYETVIYKRPVLGEYKTGEFDNSPVIFIVFSPQANSTSAQSVVPLLLDISPLRRVYFDVILNKKLGLTLTINTSNIKADLIIGALIYKYGLNSQLGLLLEAPELINKYSEWLILGRVIYHDIIELYKELKPKTGLNWFETIKNYIENNQYDKVKEVLDSLILRIEDENTKILELFNQFKKISKNISSYQPVTHIVVPVLLQVQNYASLTNNLTRNIQEYLKLLKDVSQALKNLTDFLEFLEMNETELIKAGISKEEIEKIKRNVIKTYMVVDTILQGLITQPTVIKIKLTDLKAKVTFVTNEMDKILGIIASNLRSYRAIRKAAKSLTRIGNIIDKLTAATITVLGKVYNGVTRLAWFVNPTVEIFLIVQRGNLALKLTSLQQSVVRAFTRFGYGFYIGLTAGELHRYGFTTRIKVGLWLVPFYNNPIKQHIFYTVLEAAISNEKNPTYWKDLFKIILSKIKTAFNKEIENLEKLLDEARNAIARGDYQTARKFVEELDTILERISWGDTGFRRPSLDIGDWAKNWREITKDALKDNQKLKQFFEKGFAEAIIDGLKRISEIEEKEKIIDNIDNIKSATPFNLERFWGTIPKDTKFELPFPTNDPDNPIKYKKVKFRYGHVICAEIETIAAKFFNLEPFKTLEAGIEAADPEKIKEGLKGMVSLIREYKQYGKYSELFDALRALGLEKELFELEYAATVACSGLSPFMYCRMDRYAAGLLRVQGKIELLKGGLKSGSVAIKSFALEHYLHAKGVLIASEEELPQLINEFKNLPAEFKLYYYGKGTITAVKEIHRAILAEIQSSIKILRSDASIAEKLGAAFGTAGKILSVYVVPILYVVLGGALMFETLEYWNAIESTRPEKTGYLLTYNIESGLCTLPICPMISPLKDWILEKTFDIGVWSQKLHFVYFAAPPFDLGGSQLLNPVGIFIWKEEAKIFGIPASAWKLIGGILLIVIGFAAVTVALVFTGGGAASLIPYLIDFAVTIIATGFFVELPYPPFSDVGFAITLNVPRIVKEAGRSVLDRYEKFKEFIENVWRNIVSHGNKNLGKRLTTEYLVQDYLFKTGKIIYVIKEDSPFFEYACKYLYFGKYENGKCYVMYWLKEAIKDFPALNKSIWPAYPIEIDKKYMFDYYPSFTTVISSAGSKEFVLLLRNMWEATNKLELSSNFTATLKEIAKEYNETITEYPYLAFQAPYIPVMYELYKQGKTKELALLTFYVCYSFLSKYQLYAPILSDNPMFNYTYRLCKAFSQIRGCLEYEYICAPDEFEEECYVECKKEIDASKFFDLYIAKAIHGAEPISIGLGTTPVGATVDLNKIDNEYRKVMFTSPVSFVMNNSDVLLSSTLVIPLGYTFNKLRSYVKRALKVKACLFYITPFCWEDNLAELVYHPLFITHPIKIKVVITALNNTIANIHIFKAYKIYDTEIVNVSPSVLRMKYFELVRLNNYNELLSLLKEIKKEGLKVAKNISIIFIDSEPYILFEGIGVYPATYRLISGYNPTIKSFYSSREFLLNENNFAVIPEDKINEIENINKEDIIEVKMELILYELAKTIGKAFYEGILQTIADRPPYETDIGFKLFSTSVINELLKQLTDEISSKLEGKIKFDYIEQSYWWKDNTIKFIKEKVVIIKGKDGIKLLVYKPYISFIDFRPKVKELEWISYIDLSRILARICSKFTRDIAKTEVIDYDEWATYRTYEKYPAPYSAIFGVTVKVPADEFLRDYERCKTEYGKCMVLLIADINTPSNA